MEFFLSALVKIVIAVIMISLMVLAVIKVMNLG